MERAWIRLSRRAPGRDTVPSLGQNLEREYHDRTGLAACRPAGRTHQNTLAHPVPDQPHVPHLLHGPQQYLGGATGNREGIRAEQDEHGAGAERLHLVLCAGANPSRMARRSLRPQTNSHRHHVLVVDRSHDDGRRAGAWLPVNRAIFLGLGEAGAFPVASRGMQLWFPRSERGRIQGTTHFFSRFAVAITPFVAASILLAFGWRAIFYIFGSLGLLWSVAFAAYYRNRPEEHAGVNAAELAQIRGQNAIPAARQLAPWKRILTSSNMWFISLGYCCFFFGTNFYLTWYPTYLREHRHITLQALGLLGSIPLFAGMAGDLVGGSLSDFVLKKTGRARLARSIVAAPGFLLSAVFLLPAATTESATVSVMCLAASFFFLEFVIGPAWAVPMDVGGQFSGTVTGIMNMAGALAASFTPLVFGYYFGRGSWSIPFFITSGVMLLGAAIWTFLIHPERSVGDATPRQHHTFEPLRSFSSSCRRSPTAKASGWTWPLSLTRERRSWARPQTENCTSSPA